MLLPVGADGANAAQRLLEVREDGRPRHAVQALELTRRAQVVALDPEAAGQVSGGGENSGENGGGERAAY